jgi:hypothetical protein
MVWGPRNKGVLVAAGLLLILGLLVPCVGRGWQQEPLQENAQLFMHAKLNHMQQAMEGLTKENLDLVAKSAQRISLWSQASQWQVIQTPEYVRRSAEFRREVDLLTEAAKGGNLDAATLAYLKVTMGCVECHKYVRSVRHVGVLDWKPTRF